MHLLKQNQVKNRIILLIISFVIPAYFCQAQSIFKSQKTITGTFYDQATGEPVPFANVFNESLRNWSLAKENGEFVVSVNPGDTLAVTSIGYLGQVILATDENLDKNLRIALTPRQYNIDEIQVVGYRNYSDFKKAFEKLEIDKTQEQQLSERLKMEGTKEAIDAEYNKNAEEKLANPGFSMSFGSSTSIPSVRVILDGLKKKDEIQYQIDLKFNREIVSNLTHLEGDELTNFIGYCNFSTKYLQNASEYEIVEMIMRKLRSYKVEIDSTGEVIDNETQHNLT